MERILFGDNQFFAVNHISDEKSRALAIKYRSDASIIETLHVVHDAGVNTFMCTTHDRMLGVAKLMQQNTSLTNMTIYPCLPYAHKYANAVTELGIMGTINQYVPGNFVTTLFKGGLAFMAKDYISMMELMIDAELKMFKNSTTPVIFLQNIVTDLLLGLGMGKVLKEFHVYVQKRYNVEAGFITMNMPKLTDVLLQHGIHHPIICSSINNTGFRMSGGKLLYEKYLHEGKARAIAMQIFSGGNVSAEEAIKYVCSLPNIQSILFGSASSAHIYNTVSAIRNFDKRI